MISEPIEHQEATELATADSFLPELLRASVEDYIEQVNNTPAVCGTADQQVSLLTLVADGSKLIKLIGTERLKITKVLDDEKAVWIKRERALTEPIDSAMLRVKKAVEFYNREVMLQRQRDEALQRQQLAQVIEEKGEDDWLAAAPPLTAKPKGVREVWTHKITDASQVPAEYLTVDVAKVKQAIASGIRDIPGVSIYQDVQTTYRA